MQAIVLVFLRLVAGVPGWYSSTCVQKPDHHLANHSYPQLILSCPVFPSCESVLCGDGRCFVSSNDGIESGLNGCFRMDDIF